MMRSMTQVLGPDGELAQHVSGFAPRPQQQAMAEAVEQALNESGRLVVEAGTGVGKTFAYLAPALRYGGRVIISTGTRNLQDQLFHRDLPLLERALGCEPRAALLKGRANYLCLHRLELALEEGAGDPATLRRINDWARITATGDIAEVGDIGEDAPIRSRVTSTVDNCLGVDCPWYQQCWVVHARRAAQEADLVVINHHLLLADLALKEEGFGELLPSADAFILDEAHQLPELASAFFGEHLSSRQLRELARDTAAEHARDAPEMAALGEAARRLESASQALRGVLGPAQQRAPWTSMREDSEVNAALDGVDQALANLAGLLAEAGARGKGLEVCGQRAVSLQARLAQLREPSASQIQWYETFTHAFALHNTPLEVSQIFSSAIGTYPSAWVFTSATLAVGGSFEHFNGRLGLEGSDELGLDSPFDYARNALLYLPKGLPDPNEPGYTEQLLDRVEPVIRANNGRSFLLFTSYRALREAAASLSQRVGLPLLVQGTDGRDALLRRFRDAGNAVLLGTSSFWEGVDVRGEALSCVVIDRLPFAAPGDPVLQARLQAIREQGGNPFYDYQLPQAVLTLKQGVGRLIRDARDRGVLILGDPRVQRRGYGRVFLDSLPPVPVTRDLETALGFLSFNEDHEAARA